MGSESTMGWGARLAVSLLAVLLLAGLVGTTGAGAHPGEHHGKGAAEGSGLGIEVTSPADEEWSGFHGAVQWGDTAEVDDQEGQLVYAGSGCTPISYLPNAGDFEGNIAIADGGDPDDPTDQCPASTFAQKVNSAEAAGAAAFVQIPLEGEEPNANATAVTAGIPALEVHRTDAIVALRDAVADGETVEAQLVADEDPLEDVGRLFDEPCVDGLAAGLFECDGIDLLSFVPQEEFNGAGVSDLWGWTDPEAGDDGVHDEYVIVGKTNGVGFFRVTDPTAPEYLGELPNDALLQEVWHDIKVHDGHAFIVSESAPHHGMKVFDLRRLRDAEDPERVWDEDALYPLTFSAHNLEINTETGYAYIVGGNAALAAPDHCLSGLHMVDINTPTSPTFAGCYLEEGGPGTGARTVGEPATELSPAAYVHDAQCVVYDGPDPDYTGRELCFNSAEDEIVVADVTDKLAPETLAVIEYDYPGYTHQAWLTEDHRYLVVNDELDELDREEVEQTRTIVVDLLEITNDAPVGYHDHETESITHNNYIVDGLVYQSNYTSGLRVLDTDLLQRGAMDSGEEPLLDEIAYFDTFPAHGDTTFQGTWSNYPFFESGTIAVSGIDEGLFLLSRPSAEVGEPVEDGAGVEVTCTDCPVEVRAGERGSATVAVANTGEGDDAYDLHAEGVPDGWQVEIEPREVDPDAGETQAATVTISVPRQGRAQSATLEVVATSRADQDVSDRTEVEVDVRRGAPSESGPPSGEGERPGNRPTGTSGVSAGSVGDGGPPAGGLLLLALAVGAAGAGVVSRRLAASFSRR